MLSDGSPMKIFRFPLDPAVKLWQRRLELEEVKLGQLLTRKATFHASVQRLNEQRQEVQEASARCVEVQAVELLTLHGWKQSVKQQLTDLATRIKQCDSAIEKQRVAVQEAMRSLKTLERLKEKRFEEWKKQIDKDQEELAAELFLANHHFG